MILDCSARSEVWIWPSETWKWKLIMFWIQAYPTAWLPKVNSNPSEMKATKKTYKNLDVSALFLNSWALLTRPRAEKIQLWLTASGCWDMATCGKKCFPFKSSLENPKPPFIMPQIPNLRSRCSNLALNPQTHWAFVAGREKKKQNNCWYSMLNPSRNTTGGQRTWLSALFWL